MRVSAEVRKISNLCKNCLTAKYFSQVLWHGQCDLKIEIRQKEISPGAAFCIVHNCYPRSTCRTVTVHRNIAQSILILRPSSHNHLLFPIDIMSGPRPANWYEGPVVQNLSDVDLGPEGLRLHPASDPDDAATYAVASCGAGNSSGGSRLPLGDATAVGHSGVGDISRQRQVVAPVGEVSMPNETPTLDDHVNPQDSDSGSKAAARIARDSDIFGVDIDKLEDLSDQEWLAQLVGFLRQADDREETAEAQGTLPKTAGVFVGRTGAGKSTVCDVFFWLCQRFCVNRMGVVVKNFHY